MTILEAIETTDAHKYNTYTQRDKLAWLSQLDGQVQQQILDTHAGAGDIRFSGYDASTDLNTQLLIPAPFDQVYLRWLEAQIDYANGEYGKYNNAMAMYQAAFQGFADAYNRTHMPLGKGVWKF